MLIPWGLVALTLDQLGARRGPPSGRFDAIVVAGCAIEPDGTPRAPLRARVARAVALWRAGLAPRVIFTGGLRGDTTEAASACRYAETLGLPAEAAIIEDQSTSTEENAALSARLVGNEARIVVVTDTYHLPRAIDAFRFYFKYVDGAASRSPIPERVVGSMREAVALLHYLTIGKLRRAALVRELEQRR